MLSLLLIPTVFCSVRDLTLPLGGPRLQIQITSATDFCMFLPPNPNQSIATSEGYPRASESEAAQWAVSYCTQANTKAPSAKLFPSGLLTGVHFAQGSNYVQITGTWNPNLLQIVLDGGGYYDFDMNVNSPPGGICQGYDSFYNSVNPIDGIYCIKCCTGIATCDISNGEKGCSFMVPGDYSSTFQSPLPALPSVTGGNSSNTTSSGNGTTASSVPGAVAAKSAATETFVTWLAASLFGILLV